MGTIRGVSFDRERLVWWVAALALVAAVGYVVFSFLGTFLLGLFVYYATRPIYRQLEQRIGQQTLAAGVALLGLAFPGLLLLGYTIIVAVRELASVAGDGLGQFGGVLGPYVDTSLLLDPEKLLTVLRESRFDALRTGGAEALRDVLGSVVTVLGVFASVALGVVIVLVVAFYLLRDDDELEAWFRSEVAGDDSPTVRFALAVDADLETVYFGNILTAFVIAIIAAIVYNALSAVAPPGVPVPSPTLLGLLTGLASLVPVVGMKLVYVPVGGILAAFAVSDDPALLWFPVAFVVVSFVIVDSIPEIVLRPYVSGRDLHTGLVMLAYILGPVLFGWYGLFLGPLLLVLVVHFVRVVLPELVATDRAGPPPATGNRGPSPVRPPFAPVSTLTRRTAADGDGVVNSDADPATEPPDDADDRPAREE